VIIARLALATIAARRVSFAGAEVVTRAELAAELNAAEHQSSRTSTWLVLGIALGYALLAVANTMAMASSGRRRELAALQLAGATRRQVLSYVAAESLVAIVAGTVVAALAGGAMLAVDWLGLHGLIGSFPVALPWRGAGAVVGVLAATGTAARALRARPRAADARAG
jgi:putative ABC transport system permease protein